MDFTPATADQVLAIKVNAEIEELAAHERFASASADMVDAIVEGIGQFSAGEFAPLNRIGDSQGARLDGGAVSLPCGFAEAYSAYVAQGWNAVAGDEAFGGQGLPFTLAVNVLENLGAANLVLDAGDLAAIEEAASAVAIVGARYLPAMEAMTGR